ncbi:NB-ARC domain-containing protein [Amycolatopsis sp. cg5]|uniref:ATP-binding protein n=1 Tax=Amycolatopsis sp. cg5 TaxID=3238802 RepID=UPI003525B077
MADAISDGASATFGELLKGYRVRAGVTQQELAEQAGISVRAISDMERGTVKSPQRGTIELLAPPLALAEDELTSLQKSAKRARAPMTVAAPLEFSAFGTLPADIDDLTGRKCDLGMLRALAVEPKNPRRSGRFAVLSGPPGTGKTSLAVRAAHDFADRFPDGQLFLKLRGLAPEAHDPADVLHQMLRSLGVDTQRIPSDLENRVSMGRLLLEDRAVFIVLDDAADEAQVRPLLVGGPRCLTLVTSRQMLVGIEGAQRLSLDVLGHEDALALLAAIVGEERVAGEREAASELVELCGRLPLALRIAGNRLASRPMWPLTHLVGLLRDQGRRLTALTAGDLDVRSVFELSYRQLSPNAGMVFRRLSLVPSAEFSAGAVMALIDAPDEDDAAILLEELADASLLQTCTQNGRYQFHDLLRVFATERLSQDEAPETMAVAESRLVRWLVRTAAAAAAYFQPTDEYTPQPRATPWFADHAGAGRWLAEESPNWLAAAEKRAESGAHQEVLDLARAMHWYAELGGTVDIGELLELAVRSAIAVGSKLDEALHRNYLSRMRSAWQGDRSCAAVELAEQACAAAQAAGDLRVQGWALTYLAVARRDADGPDAFLEPVAEAVRLFEKADYPLGVHLVKFMRAEHAYENGGFEDAAAEFDVCVRYFRQLNGGRRNPPDDINFANLLLHSAQNLAALKAFDEALGRCDEALELFGRHGVTMGKARTLQAIGGFLRQRGELAKAHDRLAEAHALFERAGLPQSQVETLSDMAVLSDELGDPVSARGERERALSLCGRLDSAEAVKLREKLTVR